MESNIAINYPIPHGFLSSIISLEWCNFSQLMLLIILVSGNCTSSVYWNSYEGMSKKKKEKEIISKKSKTQNSQSLIQVKRFGVYLVDILTIVKGSKICFDNLYILSSLNAISYSITILDKNITYFWKNFFVVFISFLVK